MNFETDGVSVRYSRSRPLALRDVSIQIPSGSLYAVLGPNGSGKSTLLRALLGSVPLEAGHVRLAGRPVHAWSRRAIARSVGVVTQHESVTFPISVRDFVSMGRYPHLGAIRGESAKDRRAVAAALEACRVADLADRWLGTLSGGEWQRARIARAMAQEPDALALDEPTASLDLRHEMAILHLLRTAADDGRTVVLVTHQIELAARFADRILLLDGGRVGAEGTPDAVLREEVLERVYRWPVAVTDDPATGHWHVTPLAGAGNEAPGPRPGRKAPAAGGGPRNGRRPADARAEGQASPSRAR